eukprot:328367_1
MQSKTTADPTTKKIVFGYIHIHERKLKLKHITDLITYTCLLYYCIPEHFKDKAKTISLSKHRRLAKQNGLGFGTAYGKMEIDPRDSMTYLWKFLIVHERGTNIGIACHTNNYDHDFAGDNEVENYAYCQSGDKYSHEIQQGASFMESFQADDIIWMRLDFTLNTGTLEFKNEKQKKSKWMCAFSAIHKKNQVFHMAVSLYRKSAIKLLMVDVK